jgi:hypothetical protein
LRNSPFLASILKRLPLSDDGGLHQHQEKNHMAYTISESQMAKLKEKFAQGKASLSNYKKRMTREKKSDQVFQVATAVGAAGAMGFLRGKQEDASGVWNVPVVKMDVEMIAGVAAVGAGFFEVLGDKMSTHALNAGVGILAHYGGQVARKFAKTGDFSQVAGSPEIGALPGYDPIHAAAARNAGEYDTISATLAGL